MTKKQKVAEILKRLYKTYPKPKTSLYFKNPLELLIATILSAQTTDKTVNSITPDLFRKYRNASDFAHAQLEELDRDIAKINFHHNKAKSIKACCRILTQKYQGKVPDNITDLDALPGVARKTANVVLGSGFNKAEGIVVDTHVMRLSQKIGLTSNKNPDKIEQDLMKIVPKEKWIDFSNLLILHGRNTCKAKKHSCENCPLENLCPDKNNK